LLHFQEIIHFTLFDIIKVNQMHWLG